MCDNKQIIENLLPIVQKELNNQDELDDTVARRIISKLTFEYIENENFGADFETIKKIIEKLFLKTRSKVNILKPLIEDNDISEIMVNGPKDIFYEKNNSIYRYYMDFDSEEEIENVLQAIAGQVNREINELSPILDARLPDGSRVNGVFKSIAITGPSLTIRKFHKDVMDMEKLIENNTITAEAAKLLEIFTRCGYNIFISGGTSSGKTTLINALSKHINRDERVIIIEDSAELNLKGIPNLVQMECRNNNSSGKGEITISDLIKNSLRMRPDRIIVGEVRGAEVFYMLQAMNTGHSGMSTGHGNSIEGMLKRLETMYLMAVSIDIDSIRSQIAEGIDIMVHVERRGKLRRITEITELLGYDDGQFILNPLITINKEGLLVRTGNCIQNTYKASQKEGRNLSELQEMGFNIR